MRWPDSPRRSRTSGASTALIQPTAVDTPFPQHARNYQDKEPKLRTPMIEPKKVAQAILDAAQKPTRAKRVGLMSKLNTATAKLAPALADMMAAKQADRQQYYRPHPRDGWETAEVDRRFFSCRPCRGAPRVGVN